MERLTTNIEGKTEMICRFEDCMTDEDICPYTNERDCPCMQAVIKKLARYEDAEERESKWIPCSERLPEESGTYNITAFDGGKYRTTNAMWQKRSESWNLKGRRAHWSVIAWQPLPAPYQPTRESCSNRHENGNCLAVGGFCTSVDDKYCKYHKKKTNFDRCCESMEAMAQIIDIAKIGWTKDQIMEWLQSEVEE